MQLAIRMAIKGGVMGYGDGSIYQRQRDGRWVAAVDAGFLPSGARRRKTFTGASKAEVRNRMRGWTTGRSSGHSAHSKSEGVGLG